MFNSTFGPFMYSYSYDYVYSGTATKSSSSTITDSTGIRRSEGHHQDVSLADGPVRGQCGVAGQLRDELLVTTTTSTCKKISDGLSNTIGLVEGY